MQHIVHDPKERGVALKATEQPIDTFTAADKAFLGMLGVFAEFDTKLRREPQMEGIADVKVQSVYRGKCRCRSIDCDEVWRRAEQERMPSTEIVRTLGISRTS